MYATVITPSWAKKIRFYDSNFEEKSNSINKYLQIVRLRFFVHVRILLRRNYEKIHQPINYTYVNVIPHKYDMPLLLTRFHILRARIFRISIKTSVIPIKLSDLKVELRPLKASFKSVQTKHYRKR